MVLAVSSPSVLLMNEKGHIIVYFNGLGVEPGDVANINGGGLNADGRGGVVC
jgi:hypothetical protein